jgi:hypothetical protein
MQEFHQEEGAAFAATHSTSSDSYLESRSAWSIEELPELYIRGSGLIRTQKLVGGPRFEPGASRSRTGTTVCPSVSRRFLACPPVLNRRARRVLSSPPVSSWFRNCVTQL